jgi:hypothetical protein
MSAARASIDCMTNARSFADRLAGLLRVEQGAMADFLVALADFDERRGWKELGYSSLFDFLHRDLRLSKGAAHYRMTAAKLVQRFPEIVEPLRDGRLCITTVVQLAKVLTPENRRETLPKFFQRSKREAMAVAAALKPDTAAPHRDVITAVRSAGAPYVGSSIAVPESAAPGSSGPPLVQPVEPLQPLQPLQPLEAHETAPLLVAKPPPRDAVEPLTAEQFRIHVTVSRRFLEKLEAARAALSHRHPGGRDADVLEAGLDLILEKQAKRNGMTDKPRKPAPAATPPCNSHIPASVRREVWKRDKGRCQWPLDSGGICGSTYRVECDHRVAEALGGPSTVDNLRLLCRFHNDLAARATFGDAWMDQFTRGAARKNSS